MPSAQRRNGNTASRAEPSAAERQLPFEEVRRTLRRAAADSQSNELTEQILLDFLPTAATAVAARTNGKDAYEALSTALLTVACALNAPIGFLDCVLSMPWHALQSGPSAGGEVREAPAEAEASRRRLLNLRLQSYLTDVVLDFIYRPEYANELPPIMRSQEAEDGGDGSRSSVRTFAGAALDGGTALHFAAASGRNKQVTWLLANGADLRQRTSAGDLPIQLVPKCEEPTPFGARAGACKCAPAGGGCLSQKTRELMAWHTFCDLSYGLWAWIVLLVASLVCVLGIDGCHDSFFRREIGEHAIMLHVAKKREARAAVRQQLQRMRARAQEARRLVDKAVAKHGPSATRFDHGEPGGDTAMTCSWQPPELSEPSAAGPSDAAGGPQLDVDTMLKAALETVTVLQDLAVKSVPSRGGGWLDLPRILDDQRFPQGSGPLPPEVDLSDCQVLPSEQAGIFLCMAQAVFIRHRALGFPGEASKRAIMRMGLACDNGQVLLSKLERHPERYPREQASVGRALVRMLHAHACLLLATHAQRSATPASVAAVQTLLLQWEDASAKGFAASEGLADDLSVACLKAWEKTAAADLELAAALRGRPLGPEECLTEALAATVDRSAGQEKARLTRPATKEAVRRLEGALSQDKEAVASGFVLETVTAVLHASAAEVRAAENLRAVSADRGGRVGAASAVRQLKAAIADAAGFSWLEGAVASARQLLKQWEARGAAAGQLEAELEAAKRPLPEQEPEFRAQLSSRIERLGTAVAAAQQADLPAGNAKKLQAEMRAQLGAAEAAGRLRSLLQAKPCNSATLKAGLIKAEAAAAAAGPGGGACGHSQGSQLLHPLLLAARRQLEVERASEQLQRTVASSHGLADLPKLEAAILSARKTGGVDPDILRAASEARAGLDRAAKTKAALEAAVRALGKARRPEDLVAVEAAMEAAKAEAVPLDEDVRAAANAVAAWQAAMAAEEKLARALEDCNSSTALGWAVQEAVAAGVKETAKGERLLKAVQNLEAIMQRAEPDNLHLLRDRITAAEQAGTGQLLLSSARALERRMLLTEAKLELEAAMKSRVDRMGALEEAADKAELLLADSEVGPGDDKGLADESEGLHQLLVDARARVQEAAREQERLAEAKAAEAQAKAERARAERERERQAREQREQKLRQEQEAAEHSKASKSRSQRSTASEEAEAAAQPVENGGSKTKPPPLLVPAKECPEGAEKEDSKSGSNPPSAAPSTCDSPISRTAGTPVSWNPLLGMPAASPQPLQSNGSTYPWHPAATLAAPAAMSSETIPSGGIPSAPFQALLPLPAANKLPTPAVTRSVEIERSFGPASLSSHVHGSGEGERSPSLKLMSASAGAGALAFGAPGFDAFTRSLRPSSGKAESSSIAGGYAAGQQFRSSPSHDDGSMRVSSPFPGVHQWNAAAAAPAGTAAGGSPGLRLNTLSRLERVPPDLDSILLHNFSHYNGFVSRSQPQQGQ